MPGPPYQYHRRQNNQHGGTSSSRPDVVVLDLFDLNQTLLNSHQKRNETFDKSRKIQLALVQVRSDIEDSGGGGGKVQGRAAHDQDIVESIIKIQDSLVEAIETSTTTTTSTTTKEEGDGTTTTNTRSASRVPRDANLNQRVEELCRIMAYHHFLTAPTPISAPTSTDSSTGDTGIHLLLPPSKLLLCHKQQSVVKNITITDEEYLAGACMGLCQDLSHYAMGRATARDIESVQQARDVVSSILDYLLTFDFRNGFLRRKYDGTKYQLKSLETLLYELSVTGCTATSTTSTSTVSSASSTATATDTDTTAAINSVSTSTYAVDVDVEEELTALHHRMEHRDQLRETLIKKCRDGQKMAKQAIYALHRKDYSKAQGLITNCETWIVQELTPIVKEEPPLRYGSYAAVIEEYVEAKLFYVWLVGKETNEENNNNNNMDMDIEPSSVSVSSSVKQAGGGGGGAKGQLLLPHEFSSQIHLEPVEYLGGLCDLTGEIGRYAVQRGTARDYDGVGLCLESNSVILNAIVLLERAPPSINKKMEQLRKSVTKIKRMTYEMSLSQAAGMNMTTSATTETEDNNKNNNDTE